MSELFIRKATVQDVSIIQDLNNELFNLERDNYDSTLQKDWPLTEEGKNYFLELIENHYVVLAVYENEIVGYLAGTINEKGTYEKIQYGEINNMFIKNKYRGNGIGKVLINHFKDYCKEFNVYDLKVMASCKNINAIEFYKTCGFSEFDITLTANFN